MPNSTPLKFRVDGMDCASCALKIEKALQALPGVSQVALNYGRETLSLVVDEGRTAPGRVEATIHALGFTPTRIDSKSSAVVGESMPRQAWWRTSRGQLVIGTGTLLLAAYALSHLEPEWASWPYVAATLIGLIPIVRRAGVGIATGTPFSIETLMTIAAMGALAIGEAPESAIVVFLFTTGELLEGVAAGRARAGIEKLLALVPAVAQRFNGSELETVPVEQLKPGDLVMVRPGDRVPSDGEVTEGTSEVDEAPVSGESMPVAKTPGSIVYAGSININGELRARVSRSAADNTIARIIHAVEEAQATKAPIARFIDSFSRWYTPGALAFALLVVIGPPLLTGADWFTWIYRGLAVLLVACPCALVISTPAAIASGLASGARRGLLIKGGAALEILGKVKVVAFDKTGTLTRGKPKVTDVIAVGGST